MKGKFITVEGGEGVGKSSNIAFIADFLRKRGKTVRVTREPGGTLLAETIRRLLLTPSDEPLTKECELFLIFAARAQHVHQVIFPALERGEWVVCDRFTDATYAYQGAGRGISEKTIAFFEQFTYGAFRPDLTILLDLTVQEALARVSRRGNLDRLEQETLDFFERVRDCYLKMAAQDPRFCLISAMEPLEKVQIKIETFLDSLLCQKVRQ